MDTKCPIIPSSDRNSYIYVIVDAFLQYVAIHPLQRNDAVNAISVLFTHWIVKFGMPDILPSHNGNEKNSSEFTHYCRVYNVQFKIRTLYAPQSNGLVVYNNRQHNIFFFAFF